MKNISTLLVGVLLTSFVWAQSPGKLSYQAVIRDAENHLVIDQEIGLNISIIQNTLVVYTETQTPTTNINGLVSIEIGNDPDFNSIDWANGPYFIQTEIDPTGGTNYSITGTSEFLSVPYALYAQTAENLTGPITETDPIFNSSQASYITASDITNLSNLSGINTGDQDLSNFATIAALGDSTEQVRSEIPDVSGFLSDETDPVFIVSPANGITEIDITNWNNKLDTEIDGSVTNELQVLSISNDTIYLSSGGYVKIPEQKSVPALITKDDFSCSALKNYWTVTTTGSASIGFGWNMMDAISLSTNGGNSIKLRSNRQKSVTEGKLIFNTMTYTYEDNNNAYGPLVRGLVNGTDRNNAIEFINVTGSIIQARTVSGGVATTTNYAVGASVGNLYSYTIIASALKVEFYFEGSLIATHTTNIPTTPLNMYFDASTPGGNVPQCIDDAKFEIIKY